MIRLENWAVVSTANPYTPPECITNHLRGQVYGHPRFEDGKEITTSSIEEVVGNIVTTYSGSQYKLVSPDPNFVEWCNEHGHHVPTEDEPIRFRRNLDA